MTTQAGSRSVTVVIPSKDRFAVLSTTLASVLAQRDVDVTVVVVEDGGSDGTTERLSGRDPRVTAVRHEQSRGVSAARNTGLELARTPWVAFVDDDDLWAPYKLARQLDALAEDRECAWACSAAATFYGDGSIADIQPPPPRRDASVDLLRANVVPGGGSGVLAAVELVRAVGGFDLTLSNLADWDCWLRLAQRSPVARVASPDVGYRRHSSSMAHSIERSEAELARMRDTYASLYEAAGVELDPLPWQWYLHRLTYGSGHWRAGVRRSWRLYREHGQRRALLQPVKYARPEWARRREASRVARGKPEQHAYTRDWIGERLAGHDVGR